MPKKTIKMLLESGIIPKDAVTQLERHKLIPEGSSDLVGAHLISCEKDRNQATKFAETLQQELDKEDVQLHEQELTLPTERVAVWLQWGNGAFEPRSVEVPVDNLGRYYLPKEVCVRKGVTRSVKAISTTPNHKDLRKVVHVSPRYVGDEVAYYVCSA